MNMSKAAVIHAFGGPDAFRIDDVPVGEPAPGQVRLKQTAIGVNFAEVKQRTGDSYSFPLGDLPIILGREGAGVITATGAGVEGFVTGERVAYGIGVYRRLRRRAAGGRRAFAAPAWRYRRCHRRRGHGARPDRLVPRLPRLPD